MCGRFFGIICGSKRIDASGKRLVAIFLNNGQIWVFGFNVTGVCKSIQFVNHVLFTSEQLNS